MSINKQQKEVTVVSQKDFSKALTLIGIIALLVIVIAISTLLAVRNFKNEHLQINGKWYSVDLEEINLCDCNITSTTDLSQFINAKCIDIRNNPIPISEITALIDTLPNCSILWSVPIGNTFIDSNIVDINLSDIAISDTDILKYFNALEYIDARGFDYEFVYELQTKYPDCTVYWDIPIGAQRYDSSTRSLVIGDASGEDILNLLLFDSLESVDATGCTAYEALMYASEQLPNCDFTWTVDIGDFIVSNKDTQLNFNRTVISDIAALDKDFENLKYLPNLTYIDMCGCGVSNKQMAAWRTKYPQCKFVWEISFHTSSRDWTVRTDIQVFSTLLYARYQGGNQNTYMDLFLYCTDLVALDLGHNNIHDISALTNLKKLQAIILTDNPITDISALGELPELVYVELNKTPVSDLTPLQKCTKLKQLDICNSSVRRLTPLYECPSLENVLFVYNPTTMEVINAFKKALPNTEICYREKDLNDARNSDMRVALKKAFTNYESVVEFVSWENVIYK